MSTSPERRNRVRSTVAIGLRSSSTWLIALALVTCASCHRGSPVGPSPSPTPPVIFDVSGTVRDAGNLNLQAAVTVRLATTSGVREVTTGFDGRFSFVGIAGDAVLTAAAQGYEVLTQSVTSSSATLDLRLRRVGGLTSPCNNTPGTGNRVLPLLSRPFAGDVLLTNYFDHDRPTASNVGNGYQLTFCEGRVGGRIDNHQGYDWLLPIGTPLLAAADGQVLSAGLDAPFFCQTLGRVVPDQKYVEILHPPINGEQFSSVVVHLSRIDIAAGQAVSRGQIVGLSGNTGCSTEPHVHFQVWRFTATNSGKPTLVDPFGWQGAGIDPWSEDPSGAGSIWLWQPGEAPVLLPRIAAGRR